MGCSGSGDPTPPPEPAAAVDYDGVWVPTRDGFVPQGLVVQGRTAWVSGGDADTRPRSCVVVRLDLRTREVEQRAEPDRCFHGGGLAADEHGLWIVDTRRLLLLDPTTLEVRRTWGLVEPLRGSFATTDGAGLLGVGRWTPARRGALDWVRTDDLVAGSADTVSEADVVASQRTPPRTQGVVLIDGRPWFAQSVTRCGVLVAPQGRRRAFVPGAEGMVLAGDTLWVVSESGAAYFRRQGGRPLVPTVVRLDLAEVRTAPRPSCDA